MLCRWTAILRRNESSDIPHAHGALSRRLTILTPRSIRVTFVTLTHPHTSLTSSPHSVHRSSLTTRFPPVAVNHIACISTRSLSHSTPLHLHSQPHYTTATNNHVRRRSRNQALQVRYRWYVYTTIRGFGTGRGRGIEGGDWRRAAGNARLAGCGGMMGRCVDVVVFGRLRLPDGRHHPPPRRSADDDDEDNGG